MVMLKSKNGHDPCETKSPRKPGIKDYLEVRDGRNRVVMQRFVNLHTEEEILHWDIVMDRTRSLNGNDKKVGGKDPITYRHFMISPDPRDNVDAETLMAFTMDWVHEFFGTDLEPGLLGQHEVAVVIHDDNENEVMHAHVVVNDTDLVDGRHIGRRLSDKVNAELLPNRLQEIAKDYGLSYFDNSLPRDRQGSREGRYYTIAERHLLKEGKFSWKEDLANMIDIARYTTKNEQGFIAELAAMGVEVTLDRYGEWMFVHPGNPKRWRAGQYKLGGNYKKEAILASLDDIRAKTYPKNEILRQNMNSYLGRMRTADEVLLAQAEEQAGKTPDWDSFSPEEQAAFIEEAFSQSKIVAAVEHSEDIMNVLECLRINEEHKITSVDGYGKAIAMLQKRKKRPEFATAKAEIDTEIARIRAARRTAQAGEFFEGVEIVLPKRKKSDAPKRKSPVSRREAERRTGGGQSRQRQRTRDTRQQNRRR